MTTETTPEAVQQTLAEYERLAISTGDIVQIDPPEFWTGLEDDQWTPFWLHNVPPVMARATVHRNGVPTTVYVSWDESLPAVDDWRSLWERKPMKLFGAYTLRTGLRRAFRDVIGDRREPDETDDNTTASTADRDWLAELAEAQTEDAVKHVHRDAKQARAVTVALETAIRRRVREVGGMPPAVPGKQGRPESTTPQLVATLAKPLVVTPADLARALANRPEPKPSQPRSKNGRRPQKPKPRGPQNAG